MSDAEDEVVHHLRCPDGLRITAVRRPGSRAFVVTLVFRGGMQSDPAKRRGLAHLIEHLAFAGAHRERVQRLVRAGVELNAVTEKERTVFYARGHSDFAPEILALLSSILGGFAVDEADLQHEIAVLEQEQLSTLPEPDEAFWEAFFADVTGEDRFEAAEHVRSRGLRKLSPADVAKATAERLAPDRAWLVLVADHPLELAAALGSDAATELQPLERDSAPREPAVRPPKGLPPLILKRATMPQTIFQRVYVDLESTPERDAARAILVDVLGGGAHSRLFTVLRTQEGLSYDAAAAQRAFTGGAAVLLGATVKNRDATTAARHLVEITTSLREQGLDEPTLCESRARLRHSLEVTIDSAADLCGFLCTQVFFDGDQPPRAPQQWLADMDDLKLAFVNDYANELLCPDHRTDMVFGGLHIFRAMKVKRILRSG